MDVVYVRQISDVSPLEYLNGPQELANIPVKATGFKNIVFLTNPDEAEVALYVRSVGYEESDPQKNLMNRAYPMGTIIHYIVGGEGTFNGKAIRAGDCAVAYSDRPHSLITNPQNTLKFYWIIIRHNREFDISNYGFEKDNEVFRYSFEKEMREIFDTLLYSDFQGRDAHCYFMSKVYELLSWHRYGFDGRDRKIVPEENAKRSIIAKRLWEQTEYSLSVQEMAKKLGLSRKYFSRIFKQETGVLPHEYVLEHKITMARLQIDSGERNYRKLAYQLGYKDYNSFYRAFKNVVGCGPQEYVNQIWEDNG